MRDFCCGGSGSRARVAPCSFRGIKLSRCCLLLRDKSAMEWTLRPKKSPTVLAVGGGGESLVRVTQPR